MAPLILYPTQSDRMGQRSRSLFIYCCHQEAKAEQLNAKKRAVKMRKKSDLQAAAELESKLSNKANAREGSIKLACHPTRASFRGGAPAPSPLGRVSPPLGIVKINYNY